MLVSLYTTRTMNVFTLKVFLFIILVFTSYAILILVYTNIHRVYCTCVQYYYILELQNTSVIFFVITNYYDLKFKFMISVIRDQFAHLTLNNFWQENNVGMIVACASSTGPAITLKTECS